MLREKSKWQTHKDLSTDAEHRGGAIRSSDEGSVMELERRDCVVLLLHKNNPKGEDSVGKVKSFDIFLYIGRLYIKTTER